jgi:hypothetical protein
MRFDIGRIPVLLGGHAGPEDAWLAEAGVELPAPGYAEWFALNSARLGHLAGCRCCTPRRPAADALARMFRARATGVAPFFKRVIVLASPAGEAAVRQALTEDVLTAARYYSDTGA